MSKREVIQRIAEQRIVETLCENITRRCGSDIDDLAQIVYVALLETDDKRIESLHEQGQTALNCYIAAIIRNQYFSDSSRWFYENNNHARLQAVTDTNQRSA